MEWCQTTTYKSPFDLSVPVDCNPASQDHRFDTSRPNACLSNPNLIDTVTTSASNMVTTLSQPKEGARVVKPSAAPERHPKVEVSSRIASRLLNRGPSDFGDSHPNLRRALRHLIKKYRDNLSLTALASAAFVSPSHLSYLFKAGLGVSFKSILIACRIHYATQVLSHDGHKRITDLYLDAGFGDLSHFEKMFRKFTGVTPREFRNHALKAGV